MPACGWQFNWMAAATQPQPHASQQPASSREAGHKDAAAALTQLLSPSTQQRQRQHNHLLHISGWQGRRALSPRVRRSARGGGSRCAHIPAPAALNPIAAAAAGLYIGGQVALQQVEQLCITHVLVSAARPPPLLLSPQRAAALARCQLLTAPL